MKRVVCAVLLLGMVTGCAPANISAVMRGADPANPNMETRCEPTDMRDAAEMNRVLAKYDGWRLVYVSEYTTGNRFGTSGVVCLERPKK